MASLTVPYRPSDIPTGLQGYWKLNNNATDSSVNGYNLTATNTPTYTANGEYWKVNYSGNTVNASSQYWTIASASCPNLTPTSGNLTIATWFKCTDGFANRKFLAGKGDADFGATTGYAFGISATSADLYMNIANVQHSSGYAVPANKWVHLAVVFDATANTICFYVDGNLVNSATANEALNTNTDPFTIGKMSTQGQYDTGSRSDVALWTVALTPVQIKSLAMGVDLSATTYRPDKVSVAPTHWWKLNEVSGSRSDSALTGALTLTESAASVTSLGGYMEGVAGSCANTGKYLRYASGDASFNFGTGNFTISCWIKFLAKATTYYLAGNNPPGYGGNGWGFQVYPDDGTKKMGMYIGATQLRQSGAGDTWSTDVWYHIAVKRSGTTYTFYRDGLVYGGTATGTDDTQGSASEFRLFSDGSSTTTNETMQDFAIWKGYALTDAEIASLAAGGLPIQQQGIVSYWKLDEARKSKAITAVGNAKQLPIMLNKSAGFLPGDGSFIRVPDSADWDIGTGDVTIEFFANWATVADSKYILHSGLPDVMTIYWHTGGGGTLAWNVSNTGGGVVWTPVVNTWYHIQCKRTSGTMSIYIDGVQVGSTWSAAGAITVSQDLCIGNYNLSTASTYAWNGWLKEFRISNVSRSAGVPTTQYTTDANTILLMHFDTPATSPLGPAIYFDGTGDYLSLADSADFAAGTGAFTAEFFAKIDATGVQYHMFSKTDYTSTGFSIIWNAGTIKVLSAGGTNIIAGTRDWQPNVWHHVAVVGNGGGSGSRTVKLYVDGVQDGSTWTSDYNFTDQTLAIGVYRGDFSTSPMKGSMREIAFSKAIRYASNFTPSQNGLTVDANTKLYIKGNEANGVTTFIDSETSPKTITTNGNTKIQYAEDYRSCIFVDSETTPKYPYPVGSAKVDFFSAIGSGSAYVSNTGSGLISAPHGEDFRFGQGSMTLEGYFRPTEVAASVYLFNKFGGSGYTVYQTAATQLDFYYNGASAVGPFTFATGQKPLANTWHHLAVSFIGNSTTGGRMFLNGTQIGSPVSTVGITFNGNDASNFEVGKATGYGGFTGLIDDVRITKGVARYTSVFNPPSTTPTTDGQTALLLTNEAITPFTTAPYMDGTGDAITISNANKGSVFEFGTGAFTAEGWFQWSSITSVQDLFDLGQGGTRGVRLQLNTGSLYVTLMATAGPTKVFVPTLGSWYHMAVVRESTASNKTHLFINGVLVNSTTSSDNISTSTDAIAFGSDTTATASFFPGWMREIRISNIARYTDAANFIPATSFTVDANTKVYIKGNEAVGVTSFTDSATSPLTLTTNGNTVVKGSSASSTAFVDAASSTFTNPSTYADALGSNILSANNAPIQVVGKVGSAVDFEASSSQFLSRTTSDFNWNGNEFSLLFWYNTENTGTAQGLMGVMSGGTGWYLYSNGSNLYLYDDAAEVNAAFATVNGTWAHGAVAVDGSKVKIFKDSAQSGSDLTAAASYDGAGGVFYLSTGNGSTQFVDGLIDEVLMAKRYFRPEEIKTIYIKGLVLKSANNMDFALTNIAKIAGLTYASISKVGGVAIASVGKVSGLA